MTLLVQTDLHQRRILVGAAAPFAGPMTHTAKIRVIEFHQAPQFVLSIPFDQGFLNFVVQQPGRMIGYSQFARRVSAPRRACQSPSDRWPKPDGQGPFGAVKHRPHRDTGLSATSLTIVQVDAVPILSDG